MSSALIKLSKAIDMLIDRLGRSVSWLTTILMVIICLDVIMRYLFSQSENWIVELEWHLFAIIFLVGASYTLLHDKHVRVDLFYEKFSSSKKDLVNFLGILLFLVPWTMVVIYYGWDYTANSFSFREASSQANGLPARYVIKSFIVVGFALLLLQGVSGLIKHSIKTDQ